MKLKRNIVILLCYLVVGALCACNKDDRKETDEFPTSAISGDISFQDVVEGSTDTLYPTNGNSLENNAIMIDEKHFSSTVFRERIAENYDTNGDGYLCEEERNEVTYIEISYSEHEFEGERLDGFEYFSNLEEVHVSQGEEVILRNLPSLRRVTGEEGYIGTLTVENCPNVKKLDFYNILVHELHVSGESSAKLVFHFSAGAGHMVLDGGVTLSFEDGDKYPEKYIYTDVRGEKNTDSYDLKKEAFNDYTEWTNLVDEVAPLSAKEIEDVLLNYTPDCFGFAISELSEGDVAQAGNTGYEITVYNKNTRREMAVYELHVGNEPKGEEFFVRPVEIREVKVYTYSPNRETTATVTWKLEAGYREEDEETVLGQFEVSQYAHLLPGGVVKVH